LRLAPLPGPSLPAVLGVENFGPGVAQMARQPVLKTIRRLVDVGIAGNRPVIHRRYLLVARRPAPCLSRILARQLARSGGFFKFGCSMKRGKSKRAVRRRRERKRPGLGIPDGGDNADGEGMGKGGYDLRRGGKLITWPLGERAAAELRATTLRGR